MGLCVGLPLLLAGDVAGGGAVASVGAAERAARPVLRAPHPCPCQGQQACNQQRLDEQRHRGLAIAGGTAALERRRWCGAPHQC